jgi:uncharacterized membrane protein YuzA (DUF378 family)
MKNKKLIKGLAVTSGILVIVGGVNWGLIAINPSLNLVEMFLGSYPMIMRTVYGLVGASSLFQVYKMFK